MNSVDLSTRLGPIKLKNPVLSASGTCGYGLELQPFLDLGELGAVISKAITIEPRTGNRPPRICETASGMLNSIGLENIGLSAFIEHILPQWQRIDTTLIVNVAGKSEAEYVEVAKGLNGQAKISALEVNISCPNVREGGIAFGTDPAMAASLIRRVREVSDYPLIAKLTPNVTDIVAIAESVMEAGADAISLINTLKGMAIDLKTRKPALATVTGGLSGPAIKPVALRMVHEVYQALKVPILGGGGIMSGKDAAEFIICGASAVSVGTSLFRDPGVLLKIRDGLASYLEDNGLSAMEQLCGSIDLS